VARPVAKTPPSASDPCQRLSLAYCKVTAECQPASMGTCTRYLSATKCPEGSECEGLYSYCDRGVCKPRRLVKAGQSCDESRDLCLPGKCQEGRCRPNPVEGDRCDEEAGCSFPFVCANGSCRLSDPACGGAGRQ
jgi:hypothetical protein